LRSLEQFIGTVGGRAIFEKEYFFNLFMDVSQIQYVREIRIQIGKDNWDLATYRKS
jgi:hypothetical protein